MSVEKRLETLEAEQAIRRLKARYLNACDAKDVAAIRSCFISDAVIDYPPLGQFGVDGLIDIFTQMAVNRPITDVHQGHNAEIEIAGDTASARWSLSYANFNPDDNSFRLLSGFYHDKYQRTKSGWKISYTRSEPRAVIDGTLEEGSLKAKWSQQNS